MRVDRDWTDCLSGGVTADMHPCYQAHNGPHATTEERALGGAFAQKHLLTNLASGGGEPIVDCTIALQLSTYVSHSTPAGTLEHKSAVAITAVTLPRCASCMTCAC